MKDEDQLSMDFDAAPTGTERQRITKLVSESDRYREGFALWVFQNWQVWLRFKREADKIREQGRGHYSARTIGEFIRHQTNLRERDKTFKVNNNAWPDCARLYMALTPGAESFFELRGRE